jgi:adenosylhomocysteine nucleosidase
LRIAIIGAMEEEVHILRDKIEISDTITIANSEFTIGRLEDKEVVLLKSGIGKVNAAIGTTILLEKFNPDLVINTGSAGGYDADLNVGDLVVSSEVRHHDVDVTAFGYEYGQVPGLPAAFIGDEKFADLTVNVANKVLDQQVKKGLIVTGDSFMNDPVRVDFVRGKFDNLIAVEMEAAAIAQVCHQFNIPFVVIRALSDIAGKESDVSFDAFIHTAALHSTKLILEVLKEIK